MRFQVCWDYSFQDFREQNGYVQYCFEVGFGFLKDW